MLSCRNRTLEHEERCVVSCVNIISVLTLYVLDTLSVCSPALLLSVLLVSHWYHTEDPCETEGRKPPTVLPAHLTTEIPVNRPPGNNAKIITSNSSLGTGRLSWLLGNFLSWRQSEIINIFFISRVVLEVAETSQLEGLRYYEK